MPGKTEQRFTWAFAIAIVILLAVGVTSYRSLGGVSEANQWRNHTKDVLATLSSLLAAQMDVESGVRGYVLTNNEDYLDPYRRGTTEVPIAVATLRTLTVDNLSQQQRLDRLRPLLERKADYSRELLVARRRQGFDAALAIILAGEGKQSMDGIRAIVAEMEQEERRLLTQREVAVGRDEATSSTLIIGGNALALMVVAVAAFFMVRNASALRSSLQAIRDQEWLQTGLASLAEVLREERPVEPLAHAALTHVSELVGAPVGVLYRCEGPEGGLLLTASRALESPRRQQLGAGETLVGEAARSRRIIELAEAPADYLPVTSGTGRRASCHVLVLPLIYRDQVEGVLELALLQPPGAAHRTFLQRASQSLAVALATARSLTQIKDLLTTAQQQEEELRVQQEELTQINAELEEQTNQLVERSQQAEDANVAIEAARVDLQRQAEQLALSSKYKSEFLSNMSHELRTPLNSLLILSQQLFENHEGNLTAKQVTYARTINGSGHDLLTLINDILDLAKIESGTVSLDFAEVRVATLCERLDRLMRPQTEQKDITFTVRVAPEVPAALHTDDQRLQQVLKNLLSNAIKFTSTKPGRRGTVTLGLAIVTSGWSMGHAQLSAGPVLALSVSDNGIGIPADKQDLIFEAFRQVDGGEARKFGGTGLGLSISRQLAQLLGGEVRLRSTLGEGSIFTLYLPLDRAVTEGLAHAPDAAPLTQRIPPVQRPSPAPHAPVVARITTPAPAPLPGALPPGAPLPGALSSNASGDSLATAPIADDRANLVAGDRIAVIVEDDRAFAHILVELAREQGFKAVVSLGGAGVVELAKELQPDAITLDIHLSGHSGWHLLDRLKHDPHTRHIPVHVITVDDERHRALSQGAHGILTKPATREALGRTFAALMRFRDEAMRHLLVIEDDEVQREAIVETIGNGDVTTATAHDAESALQALAQQTFDCIVLDLGLPGMSGQRLLEVLHEHPVWRNIPVVVYTARDLTPADEQRLRRVAQTIVVKTAASLDRLLDETTLFLHRVHSRLPSAKRQRIERIHQADSVLAGQTVLVADDDVRNVFALASLLERYQMTVITAENGREALTRLEEHPAIALILMDVMMPEMDGYAAMRAIRAQPRWLRLPILAITAKAMLGDREQCLAAGASDYITKPIDTDQLLSMLRVWLYR